MADAPIAPHQCAICLESLNKLPRSTLSRCGHSFCSECIGTYLRMRVLEGEVVRILCPSCLKVIAPTDVKSILDPEHRAKYDEFYKIRTNRSYRRCPKCDHPQTCPKKNDVTCASKTCDHVFCFHHGDAHRGSTCAEYEAKEVECSDWINNHSKPCPKCKTRIEKPKEGCNHVHCKVCSFDWCWLCGKKYTSLHYRSFNIFGCPKQMYKTKMEKEAAERVEREARKYAEQMTQGLDPELFTDDVMAPGTTPSSYLARTQSQSRADDLDVDSSPSTSNSSSPTLSSTSSPATSPPALTTGSITIEVNPTPQRGRSRRNLRSRLSNSQSRKVHAAKMVLASPFIIAGGVIALAGAIVASPFIGAARAVKRARGRQRAWQDYNPELWEAAARRETVREQIVLSRGTTPSRYEVSPERDIRTFSDSEYESAAESPDLLPQPLSTQGGPQPSADPAEEQRTADENEHNAEEDEWALASEVMLQSLRSALGAEDDELHDRLISFLKGAFDSPVAGQEEPSENGQQATSGEGSAQLAQPASPSPSQMTTGDSVDETLNTPNTSFPASPNPELTQEVETVNSNSHSNTAPLPIVTA